MASRRRHEFAGAAQQHLRMDKFLDNESNRLNWPLNGVLIGATMSGKTTLMCNILDRIDEVYSFPRPLNGQKTLVVISPNKYSIEIGDKMKNRKE